MGETIFGVLAALAGIAILVWYVRRWVLYFKALFAEAKATFKKDKQ